MPPILLAGNKVWVQIGSPVSCLPLCICAFVYILWVWTYVYLLLHAWLSPMPITSKQNPKKLIQRHACEKSTNIWACELTNDCQLFVHDDDNPWCNIATVLRSICANQGRFPISNWTYKSSGPVCRPDLEIYGSGTVADFTTDGLCVDIIAHTHCRRRRIPLSRAW